MTAVSQKLSNRLGLIEIAILCWRSTLRKSHVRANTKVRLYRAYVVLVLNIQSITKSLTKWRDSFDILQIQHTRHVTIAAIREIIGCPPVCSQLKRLRFFGHIACTYDWVTVESLQPSCPVIWGDLMDFHVPPDWGVDASVLHAHTNGRTVQKHNASGPMYWLSGEIKMQSTVTDGWPNNVTRAAAWWRMVNSCCH